MLQLYHAVKHLPTLLNGLLLEPLPHNSFDFFNLIQMHGPNSQLTCSCSVESSKTFVLPPYLSVLACSQGVSSWCTKASIPLVAFIFEDTPSLR